MAKKYKSKWYAGGLAFECQQSGNCCSGEPGHVWVTKKEIATIAKYLGIEGDWLPRKYLRRVGFRYSLTEYANGDCVFLGRSEEGCASCQIHEVKPTQCRTWPFWGSNLKSSDHWNEAAKGCPGMNRGPLHTLVQIDEIRLMKAPS